MSSDSSEASNMVAASTSPPWNPVLIWRWGLFCGPYWASLLAGLNIVRLGQKRLTIWPVVIIMAVLGMAFLDPFMWYFQRPNIYSYVFQVAINFAALFLLWELELKSQKPIFTALETDRHPASFTLPVLLGLVPALYLWGYILVSPFLLTDAPKTVCEAFILSENWDDARTLCTINMHPAIDLQEQLELLEQPAGEEEVSRKPTYQLGSQVYDASHPERCRVDVQYYVPGVQLAESTLLQGYFELVKVDRSWLIDEWYFTHRNREPFPQGKVRMEDLLKAAVESIQSAPAKDTFLEREADQENSEFVNWGTSTMVEQSSSDLIIPEHVLPRPRTLMPKNESWVTLPPRSEEELVAGNSSRAEVVHNSSQMTSSSKGQEARRNRGPIDWSKPFYEWPAEYQKNLFVTVFVLLFYVLPAIWKFVFGSSDPNVTKSSSGESGSNSP